MKIRDFSRFWFKSFMVKRTLLNLSQTWCNWYKQNGPKWLENRTVIALPTLPNPFAMSLSLQPISPIAGFVPSAESWTARVADFKIKGYAEVAPVSLYPRKALLRTNPQAIAIIKRFERFPEDVEPNVQEAERIVRQLVTVPLTVNQFSALVSFTYNVGETTLRQSALLRYLNAGRYRAAAKEFDRWVYIGTTRFSQLIARRVAERGLFLSSQSVS